MPYGTISRVDSTALQGLVRDPASDLIRPRCGVCSEGTGFIRGDVLAYRVARLRQFVRDIAVVFMLGCLYLGIVGAVVRLVAPQEVRTTAENGLSLGLLDPELGHVNRPHSHVVQEGPEFSAEYRINGEGLRDRSTYDAAKADGTIRMLLLGDSFAFGAGNNYEDTLAVQLERKLQDRGYPIEIVKAEVSAYDTRKEALYLERRGCPVRC